MCKYHTVFYNVMILDPYTHTQTCILSLSLSHTHTLTHTHVHTHAHVPSAQLLQAVYDDLLLNPLVLDITVEDPSDEFVALRDFIDCRNAQKLESFQPPKVHQPFSEELEELCRQKLKLHKVKLELYTLSPLFKLFTKDIGVYINELAEFLYKCLKCDCNIQYDVSLNSQLYCNQR